MIHAHPTGAELASLRIGYVLVDRRTRRAVAFPEDYRKKMEAASIPTEPARLEFGRQDPPPDAFTCEFVIQASDMDLNKHTNNSSYIRICMDTVAKAQRDQRLRWAGDVSEYRVVRMTMFYAKECVEGDAVKVYLWEDGCPTALRFVFRKGHAAVYHSCFHFRHKSGVLPGKL